MKSLLSALFVMVSLAASAQTKDGIYKLDQDYTMSTKGTLKLTCSDAKVTITGTNRTNAHVNVYRQVTTKGVVFGHDEFSIDVFENDGDLTVREHSTSSVVGMIGYHYEKYEIKIELPEGTSLQVRGDDGDYHIRNVNGSIKMDVDDADVELTGCSGDDFRFQLDDGDIVMDEGRGLLDIDGDDADVHITHGQFASIVADMDDGDLEIETSLANNGEYRISMQDGLVAMTITQGGGKFDIRHDDGRVITEGNFEQVERSESHTMLNLASGTARVDIRSDDARVKLIRR